MIKMCMLNNNRPILKWMFEQSIEEIYEVDNMYKKIMEHKEEVISQMKLTQEQLKKLEVYNDLECKIVDLIAEKAFTYGIILGNNLQDELKIE